MTRHFRIIAYDVSCDRRRARLERLVSQWATRVQYSVFEGRLSDPEVAALLRRAKALLEPATDSLRVYRLCAGCAERVDCLGVEGPPADPHEVIV
jgi:CRISPR-associated protein Cas2